MKAIVTGGCGFIGSHLSERLTEEGYSVTIIDNLSSGRLSNIAHLKSVNFVEADLADETSGWEKILEEGDFVFHLGALSDIVPSVRDPQSYYRSNVQGTFNLVQSAVRRKIGRFVYAASSSCYGIPKIYPTPETSPVEPQYPYALTKRLAEEIVLHWAKLYKLPAISLRLFNVYGPRVRTSGTYGALFGILLAQKLAHKPYTIVGDGTQTRDFTFVTDVADAFLTAAESSIVNDVFNVGSGETVSVNRIVDILGGDRVFIPKRPGEPDCTFADISKIKKALHWTPRVRIETGVQRMLECIEDWRAAPVWEPKAIEAATADWFKCLGAS